MTSAATGQTNAHDVSDSRPHVVILGGGFGGLNAAKTLGQAPVRVTLIDKRNFHLFQPLLYQVAIAALAPSDIAYPIRAILKNQENTTVLLDEVTAIDPDRNVVCLTEGELAYDYLIVAAGSQGTYFGHDEWEPFAPGLKTMEEALDIRQHLMRTIAAEGRVHVIATCQRFARSQFPDEPFLSGFAPEVDVLSSGGSMIVAPGGEVLAGPLEDKEGILTAEIDLEQQVAAKHSLDVTGHYARPDIFQLTVEEGPELPYQRQA